MRHEEFDIRIRAASGDSRRCCYFPVGMCPNNSEFDITFTNDHGRTTRIHRDICSRHVLIAIVDEITRS